MKTIHKTYLKCSNCTVRRRGTTCLAMSLTTTVGATPGTPSMWRAAGGWYSPTGQPCRSTLRWGGNNYIWQKNQWIKEVNGIPIFTRVSNRATFFIWVLVENWKKFPLAILASAVHIIITGLLLPFLCHPLPLPPTPCSQGHTVGYTGILYRPTTAYLSYQSGPTCLPLLIVGTYKTGFDTQLCIFNTMCMVLYTM